MLFPSPHVGCLVVHVDAAHGGEVAAVGGSPSRSRLGVSNYTLPVSCSQSRIRCAMIFPMLLFFLCRYIYLYAR